jgi:hypothetical protein
MIRPEKQAGSVLPIGCGAVMGCPPGQEREAAGLLPANKPGLQCPHADVR